MDNLANASIILAASIVVLFASLLFIGGVVLLALGANAWSKSLSASATARAHTAAAANAETTSDLIQDAQEELEQHRPTRQPRNLTGDDIMAGIMAEREAAFSTNGRSHEFDTNANEGADVGWDAPPGGLE